jgi:tRNA pseudouridine38-40 synthase
MHIALGVEYNGKNYSGFQRQKHVISVQGELERAVSIVANEQVATSCAGRTDAGVHATGQVISFDSTNFRPEQAWILGCNAHLPRDITIRWAKEMPDNFHARFSATARRYRYVIFNERPRPGLADGLVTHYHSGELDADLMHDAAQILLGENDFTSFRGINCQSRTPMRNVHFITVTRSGSYVFIDIKANAFLLHMVRNIAGSLMSIGCGKNNKSWLEDVFAAHNRELASPTAPPDGLYLVDVTYPESFEVPRPRNLGPFFLL